jgi:hypothetical protein
MGSPPSGSGDFSAARANGVGASATAIRPAPTLQIASLREQRPSKSLTIGFSYGVHPGSLLGLQTLFPKKSSGKEALNFE